MGHVIKFQRILHNIHKSIDFTSLKEMFVLKAHCRGADWVNKTIQKIELRKLQQFRCTSKFMEMITI